MRNAKRLLTLFLAVLMVVSTLSTVAFAGFEDVSADDKALSDAVNLLAGLGVTKGTSETTYGVDEFVTRQQMAAFVYRLMKAGKSVEGGENLTKFTDLEDSTFFYMISWANDMGIIKGTSKTTFNPEGTITLQDAYAMVVRTLGYEKDGALSYPYGYIDKAEELGLNENLPLMNYTDELTRGDIAIILFNAFYAPMNEMVNGDVLVLGGGYNKIPATIATKIYKVTTEEKRVVATKNIGLDAFDNTGKGEEDEIETVILADVVKNGELGDYTLENPTVVEFASLNLSGSSDDYFLSDLVVFKRDGEVVSSISSLKKTVGFGLGKKWTPELANDYNNQPFTGEVASGDAKGYLYAAPYSYLQNAYLTKMICPDPAVQPEGTKHFITNYSQIHKDYMTLDLADASANSAYMWSAFAQIRYSGQYTGEGIDSNGDDILDYAWYQPLTFGKINADDEMVGTGDDATYKYATTAMHTGDSLYRATPVMNAELAHKEPIIYTAGAEIYGASYNEGDFVLAYVNGAANYINVMSVVTPLDSRIEVVYQGNNGVQFGDGSATYLFDPPAKILGHMFAGSAYYEMEGWGNEQGGNQASFQSTKLDVFRPGLKGKFYFAGGKLVYAELAQDAVTSTVINYTADFIMPQYFDVNTGAILYKAASIVNNEFIATTYINAVVDGKVKAVPVAEEDAYGEVLTDDYLAQKYVDKLTTYTVNKDGKYVIKYMDVANNNDVSVLDGDDAAALYAVDGGIETAVLTYVVDNIYEFGAATTVDNPGRMFTFEDNTRVIIKSKNTEGETIYTTYTAENLPKFAASNVFTNVQYVMANNEKSTRFEKLGLFYGELDGVIKEATAVSTEKVIKIIGGWNRGLDANDEPTYLYTAWDPMTGKSETLTATADYDDDNFSPSSNRDLFYAVDGVIQNETTRIANVAVTSPDVKQVTGYDEDSFTVEIGGKLYMCEPDTVVTVIDGGSFTKKTVAALNPKSDTYKTEAGKLMAFAYGKDVPGTTDYQKLVFAIIVKS